MAGAQLKWMVVVPAFNETATITSVVEQVLLQRPSRFLVIDDASTDDTLTQLQAFEQHEGFSVLSNSENLGKSGSLWRGFEQAIAEHMDVVITLDGDGQHRAEDIPALLSRYEQYPHALVIGARQRDLSTQPLTRFLANRFANFWISWASGYSVNDSQSGFRLYPVSLLKQLGSLRQSPGFVFESEVIIEAAWQGYLTRVTTIPAIYQKNRRPSHFRPVQDILAITRMVAKRLLQRYLYPMGLLAVILNRQKPF